MNIRWGLLIAPLLIPISVVVSQKPSIHHSTLFLKDNGSVPSPSFYVIIEGNSLLPTSLFQEPSASSFEDIVLTKLERKKGKWIPFGYRTFTAYSSTVDQTDSTPFITASGQRVRNGIVATNELPFGTIIRTKHGIYEVQDRMNQRYSYRYDVWMETREKARSFGKQTFFIEIMVSE